MGSENEPAKLLLPYLQRADELQKHEPLVAYYCRLYAMERGLIIPQKERTKTTNSLLISLMKQLEKDKKSLKLGPDDYLHVEGFASNVFSKADKQDRAGRADLNTAKTFYAASIFFEILNQFGELQPDLEQKQKYAAWKAADIRKALKEGRRPEPGPPGGDKDLSIPSDTPKGTYDLGPSEGFPSSHPGVDPSSRLVDKDLGPSEGFPSSHPGVDESPRLVAKVNHQPSINTTHSSYGSGDYPSNDFQQPPPPPPPPANRPENSAYPQPFHHQSDSNESFPHQPYSPESLPHQPYSHESLPHTYQSHEQQRSSPQSYPSHDQQSSPQTYPSHENGTSYTFPNYQSYPSFNDSTLPTAPTHYPSYYQGSDPPIPHQSSAPLHHSSPPPSNYVSTVQYNSGNGSETRPGSEPPSTFTFHYDSNYQPQPDKIADAHKAARFAVGALAFDDVSVAVDFLRRSLDLLTNPSASY
ncbi:protein HOMOLOG OF MAMMALIAN LYST-INTERACTING PROTEIN 5-like isoform X2 [Tasmannia lanceolata]|uniref:protein HOMOLOG OF MAMMALIAN LYST-INTERACTING PROTEIN 5-like isoform X2 n=1 Tax=Tasmannia lanceolata TaxID=3420 RepID=UPI004063443B